MLRYYTPIICYFLLSTFSYSFAQNINQDRKAYEVLKDRGEVFFSFTIPPSYSLNWLSNQLSIDRIKDDTIFAYANKQEFEKFLQLRIKYSLLTAPSLLFSQKPVQKTTSDEVWQSYPTYDQYLAMMENFTQSYPDLCKIVDIGISVGGKKIIAVKISDNVHTDEPEPRVFYSSTMHGDEPSGFVLMLRLIDYLLNNAGLNEHIAFLINHAEIYINPLANPDGLYYISDTSVIGAKRFNLNNIDLNRNFPDLKDGVQAVIQPETQYMIDFMKEKKFILSANFHDGAEVINYPWDTWERRHADDEWYVGVSREYADTAQKNSFSGYMTYLNNGITNGYDWYSISGGRQDYVNYYLHGREVTIELTQNKFPTGIALLQLWDFNKHSLVNYLFNCFKGIRGTVSDSLTGEPLTAKIFITNHDFDNSHVFSDSVSGIFYRMLIEGNYNLKVNSPGYLSKSMNVSYLSNLNSELTIKMVPVGLNILVFPNPVTDILNLSIPKDISDEILIEITDITGKIVFNTKLMVTGPYNFQFATDNLKLGIYILRVLSGSISKSFKIMKAPAYSQY